MSGEWTRLEVDGLSALVAGGDLRGVSYAGNEVLRGLSYPVRDRNWGTCIVRTVSEQVSATGYRRDFAERSGAFAGTFTAELTERRLVAVLDIRFAADMEINRAGFTLLHPITNVSGEALTITHSDGTTGETCFPRQISPDQPARDIVAMAHAVGGVGVTLEFQGDIFEMEDQRNWSDASYKTYCRPLSLPRPYRVRAGETVHQRVALSVSGRASDTGAQGTSRTEVRLPQVMLAHDPSLSSGSSLAAFPDIPVLFRLSAAVGADDLARLGGRPLALEIVFEDARDLDAQIARCRSAGLDPMRVAALPSAYLKSHQPEGPWPDGMRPQDALEPLRAAFPRALAGSGSLTNFTELNRCRPDPAAVDFVTFGNTAIVHAADDLSVCQTLEALPDMFGTARQIAAGKPLHLGLFSIGMRSNPYGADVAPNPDRIRLPMAMDDPRQDTGFAAFYAVCILALAAKAGVGSLALAMPDGPLGARGRPIEPVIRHAAALSGHAATVTAGHGAVSIEAAAGGLAANGTAEPARVNGRDVAPFSAISWGNRA